MVVKVRRDAGIRRTAGAVSHILRQSGNVDVRFSGYAAASALRVICLAQKHLGVDLEARIRSEMDEYGRDFFTVSLRVGDECREVVMPAPERRREGDEKGANFS